jgi:hypothetical protein
MKTILTVVVFTLLTGCSFIMPKPHDSEMFGRLVDVKISIDKLECGNPLMFQNADEQIERLKIYAVLRKDPQADSIQKLQEAIKKAGETKNKVFCESILKTNKTRIDVVADAWKGRF